MTIKYFRSKAVSFLLLILMLLITGFASSYIWKNIGKQGRIEFEKQAQAVANAINIRLNRDVYLLYSLRGLYTASKSVERNEFTAFGEGSRLSENFPGIYSIEFIEKVSAGNKDSFIEGVKTDTTLKPEGYSEFKIYPEENKEDYFVLKYFYPEEKSSSSLGFDYGTEKNRSVAMEEAVKYDRPVITKKIQLIGNGNPAFIILLPIYKNGLPVATEAERKNSLSGFVGVVIEVNNFFDSIIKLEKIDWQNLDMYVYDQAPDSQIDYSNFIYDLDKESKDENQSEVESFYDLPLNISDKKWTLHFVTNSEYGTDSLDFVMMIVLTLFGIIFSFFISGFLYFLGTSRRRALNLAEEMTKELKEKEEKFRTIVDNVDIGIYRNTLKDDGIFLEANPAMWKIFGFNSKEEFMKHKVAQLYPSEEDRKPVVKELQEKGYVIDMKLKLQKKGGETIWVTFTARAHHDKNGQIDWVDGVMKDITDERKLAEKEKANAEEMARVNKLMVGRELKMVALKKEIEELKKKGA